MPLLLVDSEAPVRPQHQQRGHFDPWGHLQTRDGWNQPANSDGEQTHLMVQCMETWFFASPQCLQDFFGNNFNNKALPDNIDIESIDKTQIFESLKSATQRTQKGAYGKGVHSFKIFENLNPEQVFARSAWAKRLHNTLKEKL